MVQLILPASVGQQFEDLKVPGRAGGLEFVRSYTSRGFETSPLGSGWTHNYRSFVMADPSAGRDRFLVVGGRAVVGGGRMSWRAGAAWVPGGGGGG